jgi:biopolymer transport protein ExbD
MVPLPSATEPAAPGAPSPPSVDFNPAAPPEPSHGAATPPAQARSGQSTSSIPQGPAAGTSDFEVIAEENAASPEPAPTLRDPDWLQLRAESDDVSFPVIKGAPDQPRIDESRSPKPAAPNWTWEPDDEEEEEAEEDEQGEAQYTALVDDDDQLEILDDDDDDDVSESPASPVLTHRSEDRPSSSRVALPVVPSRDRDDIRAAEEEELEEPESFTLSRSGPMTVEELDLAPMVDVAFQLVLFFMVTATTVLYKTLEIPKPSTDAPPSGVAQGRSRSLEDYQNDYILFEIDAAGLMKIDGEAVRPNIASLVERLRSAREKTGRKSMLLSAEHATKHRAAVLAYDAANDIGLGIVIANPKPPQGPAPALAPAAPPAQSPSADASKPPESRGPPS